MAKRRVAKRAPARAATKKDGRDPATGHFTKGRLPQNRIAFSARMLADIRRRYEETDDSLSAIAHDAGTSAATLNRIAREQGWVRFRQGPRDLSPAAQLATETRALVETAANEKPADLDALINRLARRLEGHIAGHEAEAVRLKGVPQSPREARRSAHDLVSLKSAAQDLYRLRADKDRKEPTYDSPDNVPTDVDALRLALARRIEAFMESRTDAECGLGPDGRFIGGDG